MPEQPILRRQRLAILLTLLLSAVMVYYHLAVFLPPARARAAAQDLAGGYSFGNDFYPIWLTSREALLRHRNPYALEMTRDIQRGLAGRPLDPHRPGDPPAEYRAFAYQAFVDLIFWPLALVGFPAVRIVLAIFLAGLTAFSLRLWLAALGWRAPAPPLAILLIFTMSSYAVIEALYALQVGLIVGFLLAASFAALTAGRLFLSGGLLAFTLMKPQMSVVVAGYLLLWALSNWAERRRFVYGFFAWTGALLGLSLIVWPRWIPQWLHVLSGYGNYAPPALIIYSLGARLGPRIGPWLVGALLVAAFILMWRMRRVAASSPSFMLTVSLLLALTSITLLPGWAVYDHVVLLPGILLILWKWRPMAASSRSFAVVLAITAVALFWQWIAVGPMLVVGHYMAHQKFIDSRLYILPFHAAATIPLAITAVLGYMMRDELRRASTSPTQLDA
jgi:hypothetical protein